MMLSRGVFLALFVLLTGQIKCNAEDNDVKLAEANNHFALELLRELSSEKPESNLFFSPSSISVALAMVYAGARGKSETELSTTLGHTAAGLTTRDSILVSYKKILMHVQTKGVTLDVANAVLVQKKLKVLESYRHDIVDTFAANFRYVDFATKTSSVASEVNEWVKNKTRGKISDIAGKGISADTVMVLLNAVYFRGLWETAFDPKHTALGPFYNKGSKKVSVKTMTRTGKVPFTHEPSLKSRAIELFYQGGRYSMVIILPRKRTGLAELRNAMTVEKMENIRRNLKRVKLMIRLPKFDLNTEYGLTPALKKLGLSSIFADADLSGITGDKGLVVTDVKHKAAIEVNEEGTVAAAATMVATAKMGPPSFIVDHPFLFYILEKDTGRVLFLGEVQEL